MSSMHKAIVLAAGRGTRMGALTAELPKPMLRIDGKPMIGHIVERLRHAGFTEILIVVGYRREVIEQYFAGWQGVTFVVQEVAEGTSKAVALGRAFAGAEPFLLTFGDIICGAENYTTISEALTRESAAAVLGVKYVDDPWQGAGVYVNEQGAVTKIIEKPAKGSSATHWNSAGLYAFAPSIFDEIAIAPKSPRGEYEIATAIEQLIANGKPVRMFEMIGAWRDVGRPEDLPHAGEDLKESTD